MTTSIRKTIIDSVYAALLTVPGFHPDDVHQALDTDPINFPSISLQDLGCEEVEQDAMSIRRKLKLNIMCECDGDGEQNITSVMDTHYSNIYAALAADAQWNGIADNTEFGNLVVEPTPGGETRSVAFSLSIDVTYAHRRISPFLQ